MIELMITEKPRALVEGFTVGRVLPAVTRRHVGPIVFFDHMGPAEIAPGHALDVPPHPHIGLSTVTYLFEGEIEHRDSLGMLQTIRPGDINWMTAGRGIAHSERTPEHVKKAGGRLHGIQLWVALPKEHEETEPSFHHHKASSLPTLELNGVILRVLIGTAYGRTSPVATHSSMFYCEAAAVAGADLELPEGYPERAVYVVEGQASSGGETIAKGTLAVFAEGSKAVVHAETACHLMLVGGAPLAEPRYMWWNFVSSSKERLEQAANDWREGRFTRVVGDEIELVPAPEDSRFTKQEKK